ncbi:MAG: UDP-glucose 4-epimerase [Brevundimonas sp.]|jgi:UDP-glucose 4-epimerase|uniref:NAD-dependent epimerase/dehydratase family protein n=1 Tax=Brevundimonas sp. TaxID=1871086 RepID=UPI0039E278C2
MRVAVTGASGFIGRYLVPALVAGEHEVVALGREAGGLAPLQGDGVTVRATDYGAGDLAYALKGVEAVVHLAGRRSQRDDDPLSFRPFAETNLNLLETLFFAARDAGVSRFVQASTIAVYSAANAVPYAETDLPVPLNPYGLSKLTSEQLLTLWGGKTGMRTNSLRLAASYGYGERISAVLMKFADAAWRRQTLTVRGNGRIGIDQIYVKDVVRAFAAALAPDAPGGAFNVGAGRVFTLLEMAEAVNAAFGNHGNLRIEDPQNGPAPAPHMSIEAARQGLGWKPEFSLGRALRDFCETWRAVEARPNEED